MELKYDVLAHLFPEFLGHALRKSSHHFHGVLPLDVAGVAGEGLEAEPDARVLA